MILGAAYMLSLVQRLFYGPESALTNSKPANDLRIGELAILTPLVVLMLVMGLAPSLWLKSIQTGIHPPPPRQVVTSQHSVILQGACAAAMYEAPVLLLRLRSVAKCESLQEAQR